VNVTYCDTLQKQNYAEFGNDTGKYKLSCGNNTAVAKSYNQSITCACYAGYQGFGCALVGNKLAVLAVLGAGLIALIVLMALLGAGLAGGGAVAVSQGVASASDASVISSPLYEGNQGSGNNPLFHEAYELM